LSVIIQITQTQKLLAQLLEGWEWSSQKIKRPYLRTAGKLRLPDINPVGLRVGTMPLGLLITVLVARQSDI